MIISVYQELEVAVGPKRVAITGVLLVINEFIFYAAIFYHLYQHNLSMSTLLPEDRVRKRIKSNVINLAGNSLKFLLKLVWIILCVVMARSFESNINTLTLILWITNFGIIEGLQAVVSPKIYEDLVSIIGLQKSSRPNLNSRSSQNKAQAAPEGNQQ